jgi:anti-sigma regulatory factor (Ser/Thr protein kinase)
MRGDQRRVPEPGPAGRIMEGAGEAELRATCRQQAAVIDALARAVGDLRAGAGALKAENAELRSQRRRQHRELEDRVAVEERVRLGVHAPATARRVVAAALAGETSRAVVERAELAISELVTNSVRHSGAPVGGYAVVRLRVSAERLRLEVEDPGHGGEVLRRRPGASADGGFGLQIVETLSERWGSERDASGGLRVWAELASAVEERDRRSGTT